MIDPRAIIHPTAKIAEGVKIGPFSIISEGVIIGEGTEIGPYVLIGPNTHMGKHNKIFSYAAVGGDPQHAGYKGETTYLKIGDHNVIREYVTISRGTPAAYGGQEATRIGNHTYLMAYCHVGHDSVLGNHVVFANTASIAGHVHIGDYANLAAFSGIHQFVRIGAYCFLGRGAKVYQDILPYTLVTGNPGVPTALNAVGLRRHGFKSEVMLSLKRAFHLIYRRELKMEEIKAELAKLANQTPEVGHMLEMINTSTRGIARSNREDLE